MAKVKFNEITKQFGTNKPAVSNLNLEITDKEFMVLVGPSGCGKTTTLRMLAGLETPTTGTITVDDDDITRLPPKDRDIAMVFQSYALYPHMTVRDNLAFGLKNLTLSTPQKVIVSLLKLLAYTLLFSVFYAFGYILDSFILRSPGVVFFSAITLSFVIAWIVYPELRKNIEYFVLKFSIGIPGIHDYINQLEEIETRVKQTAEILEIEELLNRKPKQLSGGQRQRVAVGRAIIRDPKVFLMDEPLSNLDAKLRNSTRAELAELQSKLQTTTLYVTHDQVEAMTLGHRIAVMNKGVIEQLGTPSEVYNKPRTAFVAGFIGAPPTNLVKGELTKQGKQLLIRVNEGSFIKIPSDYPNPDLLENHIGNEVIIGFRPEQVEILSIKDSNSITGTVTFTESIGSSTIIFVNLFGSEVRLSEIGHKPRKIGSEIHFRFSGAQTHLFDEKSGISLENHDFSVH